MAKDSYQADLEEKIASVVAKCWNCNFCFSVCPNYLSTRGFQTQGPSGITQSLLYALRWDRFGREDKQTLQKIVYSCTLCNACVNACKEMSSAVSLLDAIEAGRELMVEKNLGPLPRQGKCLESIFKYGSPYGKLPKNNRDWCREQNVSFLPGEKKEVLLYLGCTVSHDINLRDAVVSLMSVLKTLKVDFGVLKEECCCGDPARFLGDAALFQEIAAKNIDTFKNSGAQTIVPLSPHCYTTFNKYYPNLAKDFAIVHYCEFIQNLITDHPLEWRTGQSIKTTYHDPCYLGKHNGCYDPPRQLLDSIPTVQRVEMRHSRGNSLCCGGGGGRMFDDFEEERRLSHMRIAEAMEIGAEVVVTACPWCYAMLSDAVKEMSLSDKIAVKDIAQVVWDALLDI